MVQTPPVGAEFENVHLATKPGSLVGWVGFILLTDGSWRRRTEVVLGMKEEKFTPSGCDSPRTKINEGTGNIYSKLQGDLDDNSGRQCYKVGAN